MKTNQLITVAVAVFASGCLPRVECVSDSDCADGEVCRESFCRADSNTGSDPNSTSGAGSMDGDSQPDAASETGEDLVPDLEDAVVWMTRAEVERAAGALYTTAAARGRLAAFGDPEAGRVLVAEWTGRRWREQSLLVSPEDLAVHGFGAAISVDRTRLLVGAPDGETGAIFSYQRDFTEDGWRLGDTLSDDESSGLGGQFQHAGTTLVAASDRGIELWEGWNTWQRYGLLQDPRPGESDRFGESFSVTESEVLVGDPGSPGTGEAQGTVYSFARVEGHWSNQGSLNAPTRLDGAEFGCLLSRAADRLAVASCDAEEPHVSIFVRGDGEWMLEGEVALGAVPMALHLSDHTLLVSSLDHGSATLNLIDSFSGEWRSNHLITAVAGTAAAFGWDRLLFWPEGTDELAALHRCGADTHGERCELSCSDRVGGGSELDTDWAGPCAAPEPTLRYSLNSDTLESAAARLQFEYDSDAPRRPLVLAQDSNTVLGYRNSLDLLTLPGETGSDTWIRLGHSNFVPSNEGFEIVFDAKALSSGSGGFQFRWASNGNDGDYWAFGISTNSDGEAGVTFGTTQRRVVSVVDPDPVHHPLIGVSVRARLQVRPGRLRYKVWAVTSGAMEPTEWDRTMEGDFFPLDDIRMFASSHADPDIVPAADDDDSDAAGVRVGGFAIRDLPYFDNDPVDAWFPSARQVGDDVDTAPSECSLLRELDMFGIACNTNTAPGYYWRVDLSQRLGQYGDAGQTVSTLHSPCDREHLGSRGEVLTADRMTEAVGEFACRLPAGEDANHSDCPGADGPGWGAGGDHFGIYGARCVEW